MTLPTHLVDIVKVIGSQVVIIENHTESTDKFQELIDKYYELIKEGFEHKEYRSCPVHFKFFNKEDEWTHSLELRHFVVNLILWKPLVEIGRYDTISESYLVDCTKMSQGLIKHYIDTRLIIPFRDHVTNKKMNTLIHDVIHDLSVISTDFNAILGLSMNVETFIEVAKRNPRFNQIIRTKIDEGMQPKEIEEHLDSLMNEQVKILKTEDNFLKPILLSGTGIKNKQLAEFAINGGMKPDLYDNTIPIPIDSNFIVGGLSNVTNYYLDAVS